MKKNVKSLFIILVLSFLLRVYLLSVNFNFSAEFGDNLLDIKNAFINKDISFIGPATSHPWLYFGPLYYWILLPISALYSFNPVVGGYFGATVGVLVVLVNYLIVKKIIDDKTALVSSFLISASPLWILFSRNARFFFLTTLIFYPFLFSIFKLLNGDRKYAFWTGLFFGLFFSFHYSPLILLPTLILLLLFYREKIQMRDYLNMLLGVFITFIPLLIFDSKNGFKMFINLFAWVPYRIAGFFGLYPKNNLTYETLREGVLSMNEFFGRLLIADNKYWPYISVFALIAVAVYLIEMTRKGVKNSSLTEKFILFGITFGVLAIFIHGGAPVHYYLPLFPLASIFYASVFIRLSEIKKLKILLITLLLIIFIYNLNKFSKNPLYFNKLDTVSIDPHIIPYQLQLDAADAILKDAQGENFSIKRIGPYDYFEEDFSQNYRYLLWWKGKEPIENSDLVYTIIEYPNKFVDGDKIFSKGGLVVFKKE